MSICILILVVILYFLYYNKKSWESFVDAGRCGPNLGVCPDGLRCMNGYCKSDVPPKLPKFSDLPIYPVRYTSQLSLNEQINEHLAS